MSNDREPQGTAPPPHHVLVVRSDGVTARLRDAAERAGLNGLAQVDEVPSYLDALGRLAHTATDALIGPVSGLGEPGPSTSSALRRLAPRARLVLVNDTDAPTDLPPEFDAVLNLDAGGDELADAVGLLPRAPQPTIAEHTRAACLTDGEAGDADLLDALLQRPDRLAEMVAAVITRRGGVGGVELIDRDAADDDAIDGVTVPIRYAGQRLGLLKADANGDDAATRERLCGWAEWAARWLGAKDRLTRLYDLAMRDDLTGVWNRRYFRQALERIVDRARREREQVTLMVFDIDDFKRYNDTYGHPAGDGVLRETARLMLGSVRDHDVVARIGGDEFAVIFWDAEQPRRQGSRHPHHVIDIARRFQEAICRHRFPKLLDDAKGTLTISAGLAGYPWDGQTPEALIERADAMAMRSKRQGKNVLTFGQGAVQLGDPIDSPPAVP